MPLSFLSPPATRTRLLPKAALSFVVFAVIAGSMAASLPSSLPSSLGADRADAASYSITLPIAPGHTDRVRWSDTWGAPRSGGRSHIGVDMLGPKMVPLVAANDSVVTWGRFDNSRGTIVRLRDEAGWEYQYIHINNDTPGTDDGEATCLQALSEKLCNAIDGTRIRSGTAVEAGEFIGYLGDSGNAEWTAPHLHFEVYAPDGAGDVTPVNPTPYVDAARDGLGVEQERVGPFLNPEVAADEIYRRLEGRTAVAGERDSVRSAVARGGLATALAEIAAANPSAAMVDRLYLAFFQRFPDEEGWDHWIDARAEGHRLEDIAEWFAESNEFDKRYGSADFSTFLDQLYVDVLGRAPDQEGKAYWLALLDADEITRGTVVVYFTESAEMLRVAQPRTELTVIRRALGQDRPTDDEVAEWQALRASTDLETAIDGLLAD
ncbi:MAG: DUF4214 domain-containing protein [Acidimicrobiales bacterium]